MKKRALLLGVVTSMACNAAWASEYDPHPDASDLAAIDAFIAQAHLDQRPAIGDVAGNDNLADAYFQRFQLSHDQADGTKSLQQYKALAAQEWSRGKVRYSDRISNLYQALGRKAEGVAHFESLLPHSTALSASERFKLYADYGELLAHFSDTRAGSHYEKAAELQNFAPGEGLYRWMKHLIDDGQAAKAEEVALRIDSKVQLLSPRLLELLREAQRAQGKSTDDVDQLLQESQALVRGGLGMVH